MARQGSELAPRIVADNLPFIERSQPRMTLRRDRRQSSEKRIVGIVRIAADHGCRRDQLGAIVGDQEQLTESSNEYGPIPLAERSDELRDYLVARGKVRPHHISCEDPFEHLPRVFAHAATSRHRNVKAFILSKLKLFASLMLGL